MKRLIHFPAFTMVTISLAILTLSGWCQRSDSAEHNNAWPDACLKLGEGPANFAPRFRAIRIIADPATHQQWMLLQNLSQPASPALLLLRSRDISCAGLAPERSKLPSLSDAQSLSLPVIRTGDHLILSEHTRAIDAELEAVALTSAAIGESLTVRLKFGGRTVSAIATARGRATFSDGRSEVHR